MKVFQLFPCILVLTAMFLELSAQPAKKQNSESHYDSLLQNAWDNFDIDRATSLSIAEMLYENYDKLDIDRKFKVLFLKGYIYQFEHYYDYSAKQYFQALDLIKTKTDALNLERKSYLLQNLGVVYEKTFQYDDALTYMFDALKIATQLDHKTSECELLHNIAVNYRKKGELPLAINYHNKSLEVCKEVGNNFLIARIYNSLGLIYDERKEHELAKSYYRSAIAIADTVPALSRDLSLFQSNLGESYSLENQFDYAKKHYLDALETSVKTNDISRTKLIYNNLGDVFLAEENYKKAVEYFEKTIALGNPDVQDKELQRACKNISRAYEALGDYRLALDYNTRYIAQTDKIVALKEDLSEQNAQYRMKELDWQRELMQKEVMLASAEKENLWGRIIIGVALLLIFFSSRLIYVYYKKISRAKKIVNSYSVSYLDI